MTERIARDVQVLWAKTRREDRLSDRRVDITRGNAGLHHRKLPVLNIQQLLRDLLTAPILTNHQRTHDAGAVPAYHGQELKMQDVSLLQGLARHRAMQEIVPI